MRVFLLGALTLLSSALFAAEASATIETSQRQPEVYAASTTPATPAPIAPMPKPKYDRTQLSKFDISLSTGYTWKHDSNYRKIYGRGIHNVVTLDACYWVWKRVGIGVQSAYWFARGQTATLKKQSRINEVPLFAYLKGRIGRTFQLYGLIGGGRAFIHEKNPTGRYNHQAWAAAFEVGANYYFYSRYYATVAVQYLASWKKINGTNIDFGGTGVRAGLGVSF